jgi:hypothetical protein
MGYDWPIIGTVACLRQASDKAEHAPPRARIVSTFGRLSITKDHHAD